jgi:hypothetical protein
MRLYSAQGYTERAETVKALMSAGRGGTSPAHPASAGVSVVDRLAAFRDAARRRRGEMRP